MSGKAAVGTGTDDIPDHSWLCVQKVRLIHMVELGNRKAPPAVRLTGRSEARRQVRAKQARPLMPRSEAWFHEAASGARSAGLDGADKCQAIIRPDAVRLISPGFYK